MDTPIPRSQLPVCDRYVYLNHGGVAPLPVVAADAGRAFLDAAVAEGGVPLTAWEEAVEVVRASAARVLGASVEDVAFVKNTTEGLSFVANGLSWQPGDRVVVPDLEFPSTIFPWLGLRERGVVVDLVEPVGDGRALPMEVFEDALRAAPTRLVCTSWVQFGRGWRTDLAELAALCHEHGALLCADIIQGTGVLPTDLAAWGVDFAAADAHKWMLGPLGTGVFYVAPQHRDLLTPLEPGWASVAHREEWDNLELIYDGTARRFEGGTATIETILQMGASIDLLLEVGVDLIWEHVDALLEHTAEALVGIGARVLSDRSAAGRSANLTFDVPGHDSEALWEALDARRFVCSPRGGGVRIGPHGYNTTDELDAFVAAVAEVTGRSA